MSWRLALLSTALTLVSFALAIWPFGLSAGRAALLAPVFVLTAGAAAAMIIVWGKVILQEVRGRTGSR